MIRMIYGAGVGATHGAGAGLSEFPSDLADVGTAGSAAALSVLASGASALATLAFSIRGSDASALRMRVLAGSTAAVADSVIKPAVGGHTFQGMVLFAKPIYFGRRAVTLGAVLPHPKR